MTFTLPMYADGKACSPLFLTPFFDPFLVVRPRGCAGYLYMIGMIPLHLYVEFYLSGGGVALQIIHRKQLETTECLVSRNFSAGELSMDTMQVKYIH